MMTPIQKQFARTTGIGSLPHHNIDAAIEYAFRFYVPYFPQTPIRRVEEDMIPEAFDGMPGVEVDADSTVTINLDAWKKSQAAFSKRLDSALSSGKLDEFLPSSDSCWSAFMFEVSERKVPAAKVQITGPLTAQWVVRLS